MGLTPIFMAKIFISKYPITIYRCIMNKLQSVHKEKKLESKPDYHIVHQYDTKTKNWEFRGYKCNICEQTLRTVYVATKHACIRTNIMSNKKKEEEFLKEHTVKNNNGTLWKPLDFSKNLS